MKHWTAVITCLLLGCGPNPQLPSATVDVTTLSKNPASIREVAFNDHAVITFLSHDGIWIGTDDDMELQLWRDGTAKITDFGYSITQQIGTFELADDGTLTVTPETGNPWLTMHVAVDDDKLVILRPTRSVITQAAIDAGFDETEVTDDVASEAFGQWPLRQIERL